MAAIFEKRRLINPETSHGVVRLAWQFYWFWPRKRLASLAMTVGVAALAGALPLFTNNLKSVGEYAHFWEYLVLGLFVCVCSSAGPTNAEVLYSYSRVMAMLPLCRSQIITALFIRQIIIFPAIFIPLCLPVSWLFNGLLSFAALLSIAALAVSLLFSVLSAALHTLQQQPIASIASLFNISVAYLIFFAYLQLVREPFTSGITMSLACLAALIVVLELAGRVFTPEQQEAAKFPAAPHQFRAFATLLGPPMAYALLFSTGFGGVYILLNFEELTLVELCIAVSIGAACPFWWTIARVIRPLPISSFRLTGLLLLQGVIVASVLAVIGVLTYSALHDASAESLGFGCITFGLALVLWMITNTSHIFDSINFGKVILVFFFYRIAVKNFLAEFANALDWHWRHNLALVPFCVIAAIIMANDFYHTKLRDARGYKRVQLDKSGEEISTEDPDASVWLGYVLACTFLVAATFINTME